MKRTLFGIVCALMVGFVTGCGGSTETTQIEAPAAAQQEAEDIEAEMEAAEQEEEEGDG